MAAQRRAVFCQDCGGRLARRWVEEEQIHRPVCEACSHIHYDNPNVVAGTIPVAGGRVWLLRRGIEPRRGTWTYPAGFMELGESVTEAALRETREEICIGVEIETLLNVYSRSTMTNVQIVFLARAQDEATAGSEALEVALFTPEQIPWHYLSFWSTHAALRDWIATLAT